jgi:hypothetical protein
MFPVGVLHMELYNLYSSPDSCRVTVFRSMAWTGHIEMKILYKCSVRKHKGKRPFEQLRHRWEDGS